MAWDLKDIDYVDISVEDIENEALQELARRLGKDIYPASPERIHTLTLVDLLILDREMINDTGKQTLLAYARGDYLDHIGALMDEKRLPASTARTMLKFTMSTTLDYVNIIPKGTRAKTKDGFMFRTLEEVHIPPGTIEIETVGECETPGIKGNGIAPDNIKTIVDVFPYFDSVTNTTTSFGGAERESDEHFRQRIHEAPEKFSSAGPDGAYLYYTRGANPDITDVAVHSPKPGVVDIVPLMGDGNLPTEEIIEDVKEVLNDRKVRPLTDKVQVKKPTIVNFELDFSYYVSAEDKLFTTEIAKRVDEEVKDWIKWQREKLGRDINPDKLIERLIRAGAKRVVINKPQFKVLQYDQIAHLQGKQSVEFMGVEDE